MQGAICINPPSMRLCVHLADPKTSITALFTKALNHPSSEGTFEFLTCSRPSLKKAAAYICMKLSAASLKITTKAAIGTHNVVNLATSAVESLHASKEAGLKAYVLCAPQVDVFTFVLLTAFFRSCSLMTASLRETTKTISPALSSPMMGCRLFRRWLKLKTSRRRKSKSRT